LTHSNTSALSNDAVRKARLNRWLRRSTVFSQHPSLGAIVNCELTIFEAMMLENALVL
jgi:hypothetical protein